MRELQRGNRRSVIDGQFYVRAEPSPATVPRRFLAGRGPSRRPENAETLQSTS